MEFHTQSKAWFVDQTNPMDLLDLSTLKQCNIDLSPLKQGYGFFYHPQTTHILLKKAMGFVWATNQALVCVWNVTII